MRTLNNSNVGHLDLKKPGQALPDWAFCCARVLRKGL